ncbi:hypothetical protein [uncultured Cetobacterium sp.]|uniref:hypothetical protein n=1 Tax=uncultured Cetobacterium sp. TaxID=527638 RepID=UPI002633044A|nr:hypothetical protein [uncultured Cetobacterium sp.]
MRIDINNLELIDSQRIIPSTNLTIWNNNGLENFLDGDEETLFHSNQYESGEYGDVYLELPYPALISKISFLTNHPVANNGCVYNYEILYKKERENSGWISAFNSTRETVKGWRSATIEEIYATDICIRVHDSSGRWVVINTINIYSTTQEKDAENLKENLEKLFVDYQYTQIKEDIKLKDITKFIESYPSSNLGYVAKLLWINNNTLKKEAFKIRKDSESYGNYFDILKIDTSLRLISTPYRINTKKDYLIVSDKKIRVCLISEESESPVSQIIDLKIGPNLIYSEDIKGDIFILKETSEEINLNMYNLDLSNNYKIGKNSPEMVLLNSYNKFIIVEGKNFILKADLVWINNNFNKYEFIQAIENLDSVLDYINFLINKNGYFCTDKDSPVYKKVFWIGEESGIKETASGYYTTYNIESTNVFNKNIEEFGSKNLSELLSKGFGNLEFLSSEVKDILAYLINIELELKYKNSLDISVDEKRLLWSKLLIFSNENRFIPKIYKDIQRENDSNKKLSISDLCFYITKILQRDVSNYFIGAQYSIESEIVSQCNTYPKPTINLNELTLENYQSQIENEIAIFNMNYKNNEGSQN